MAQSSGSASQCRPSTKSALNAHRKVRPGAQKRHRPDLCGEIKSIGPHQQSRISRGNECEVVHVELGVVSPLPPIRTRRSARSFAPGGDVYKNMSPCVCLRGHSPSAQRAIGPKATVAWQAWSHARAGQRYRRNKDADVDGCQQESLAKSASVAR